MTDMAFLPAGTLEPFECDMFSPMEDDESSMTDFLCISEDRNDSFSPDDEPSPLTEDSASGWAFPPDYGVLRDDEEEVAFLWVNEPPPAPVQKVRPSQGRIDTSVHCVPSSAPSRQIVLEHSTPNSCTPLDVGNLQNSAPARSVPYSPPCSPGTRAKRNRKKNPTLAPKSVPMKVSEGGDKESPYNKFRPASSKAAMFTPPPAQPGSMSMNMHVNNADGYGAPPAQKEAFNPSMMWMDHAPFHPFHMLPPDAHPDGPMSSFPGHPASAGVMLDSYGLFERGKRGKLPKAKKPPSLPKHALNCQKFCSYEMCPNPTHTSGGSWKFVTSETRAGNRDWSQFVGRLFCNACFTQYATKGFMERLGRAQPAPSQPSSSEPEPPKSEFASEELQEPSLPPARPDSELGADGGGAEQPQGPVPVKVEQG